MDRKILGVAPYLLVEDVKKSAEWYRDHLGFDFVQLWGEPPCFVMVERDGITIMLKSVPGKKGFVAMSHVCVCQGGLRKAMRSDWIKSNLKPVPALLSHWAIACRCLPLSCT